MSYRRCEICLTKTEFSSFDLSAVVLELNAEISNSRVNNIYQLDAKTLFFKLHKPDKPPIRVVMEAGKRLHQTAYAFEPPQNPPAFCMALRSHLRNAWLQTVEQVDFERIAVFTFKTYEGPMKLILELFGEGNIILLDEKGTIRQALRYKRMRDRNILRGKTFANPPSSGKNPFNVGFAQMTEILKDGGNTEVVRILARNLGLGGTYAEELLLRTNVDKTKPCNTLSEMETTDISQALHALLLPIEERKLEPQIVSDEQGKYIDVAPFGLKRYEKCKSKLFSSFNLALDEFYLKTTVADRAAAQVETSELKRAVERLSRTIAEQEHIAQGAEEKADYNMKIGNAMYSHIGELQTLLEAFLKSMNTDRDWNAAKHASGSDLLETFDQRNMAINIKIGDLRFSISLRKNIYENAAEYFERGKKAKQKAQSARAALEDTKKQLERREYELKSAEELKSTKPAEVIAELSKSRVEPKEWYQKFRYFMSSEGFLVVAGKDAVSNEVLIKKHTLPNDKVFHAEIIGSPFVVVKTEGKEPGEKTLKEAAEFAAAFSRAWRENMGSADVYWVKPEQLSKSGPSGEFVPHGAFAVTGKRNWMRNVPLQTAVGIVLDDKIEFIGGPEETMKGKATVFVVIGPGDLSGKEILKQTLRSLTLKLPKEQREKISGTSVEAIREFIPYTKGRLRESLTNPA